MPSRAPAVGLSPYAIEGFAGLNLRDDPEEIGVHGAIDMADVDLDHRGRARQRDGLTRLTTLPDPNGGPVAKMLPLVPTSGLVVTTNSTTKKAYVLNTSWAVVASQALTSASAGDMVAYGTPAAASIYIADPGTALRKLASGTTFSTVAGAPTPAYLAVQQPDNRLVAGNTDLITDSSKVQFSAAGDPTTWGANDYVRLSPGDGESVTGLVAWRDQLFAFKSTKFFVFYGNSTDASGNPVFNYRTINTGLGTIGRGSAVAGREGVYFVNNAGVWLTTGGPPTKISGPLDPFFQGWQPAWFSGGWHGGFDSLGYALGRVYYSTYCTDHVMRTFVYDPTTQQWVVWTGDVATVVEAPSNSVTFGDPARVVLAASSGLVSAANKILQFDRAATTDDGAAISSFYRSGFFDLDEAGMEKTIRQTELVGQGVVNFSWSRDLATAMNTPSAANVTLGTAPATGRALHRNADYGELLSFKLAGVAGAPWMVDRVVPMIQSTRGAGAMG